MKKQNVLMMAGCSGAASVVASVAGSLGFIPLWASEVLIIVIFPIFLVLLGLWWNASKKEGDTPFIGF
ncbi:hypothetical protein [Methanofollis fontis]|nr:hypothetical protein [Methanofollis fontis]